MDVAVVKIICMVALFLDTIFFGWPPYFLVRVNRGQSANFTRTRKKIISYLTCFAGGVFLGACLLHLLPEGMEKVEEYFHKTESELHFPLFEAVMAGGFFLIALIEQLAHKLLHATGHTQGESNRQEVPAPTERSIRNGENSAKFKALPTFTVQSVANEEQKGDDYITTLDVDSGALNGSKPGLPTSAPSHKVLRSQESDASNSDLEPTHDSEMVQALKTSEGNLFRTILLLIALSFHTIFDGLAVGLISGVASVWQMFGAICIHKSLVALCLGTELFLVYRNKPVRAFLIIFFFALITPAGVGLGMFLTSSNVDNDAQMLTNGLLEGVATGTFLYVTTFEILREELVDKGGLLRLFLVVIGFGAMAAAKLLDAH